MRKCVLQFNRSNAIQWFPQVANRRLIFSEIRLYSDQVDGKLHGLIQQGKYQEALKSYAKNPDFPIHTTKFTFPSLLKACVTLSNFSYGQTIHSTTIKLGIYFDPYIVTSLVRMYVKCGSLHSAVNVFDEMPQSQDVAIWNSIIDGFSKNGFFNEGKHHFRRMQESNVKPDGYTLCILLRLFDSSFGKEIHAHVVRNKFDDDPFVITSLIDAYSRTTRVYDAWNIWNIFSKSNENNTAVWNSVINGFCQNGLWRNALDMYLLAKNVHLELNSTTFSSLLTSCYDTIDFGHQLHCDVIKTGFDNDPFVTTSLLTFYSKCGLILDAESVFHFAKDPKVELWNSLISAYVNFTFAKDALDIYCQMRWGNVEPDSFTLSNVLIACSMMGSIGLGKLMHAEVLKRPVSDAIAVQTTLLMMYSKLGNFKYSCKVFDRITERDVIAWGSIISASCENGDFEWALSLYKVMVSESENVKPDVVVVASLIVACTKLGDGKSGGAVHGLVVKNGFDLNALTGSALIEFYSRLGKPEMAKAAFADVIHKNIVVWNSLMSCYSQNGLPDVTVHIFSQIHPNGLHPDSISITNVLTAVSQTTALLKGKSIHGYYIKSRNLLQDIQVDNAIIDMYFKCGCFGYARRAFQAIADKDIVAWNSMISGYGSHGECDKALELFNEMVDSSTQPDEVTLLALLSACNHSGHIDRGVKIFQSMRDYGVDPKTEHYVSVVDMLGRGGRVREAARFVQETAAAGDRRVWVSLLSACRVHGNLEIGEVAGRRMIEMEPGSGVNYVQLMNLYWEAGMKEMAGMVGAEMRQRGVGKWPGCSWIEVGERVEVFLAGQRRGGDTAAVVEWLGKEMRKGDCETEDVYEAG